jgi:Tfp pilus assembly protein PilZ
VVRSRTAPYDLRNVKPSGMGVRFVPVEELLAEILPLSGELTAHPSIARDPLPAGVGDTANTPATPAARPSAAPAPLEAASSASAAPPAPNPARFHPAAAPAQRAKPTGNQDPELLATPGVARSAEAPSASQQAAEASETDIAPSRRTFTVRFRTVERLRKVWLSELQYGGLFVPTKEPLELDSLLQLQIYLPDDSEPNEAAARVVVVNQEGPESQPNLLVGMGVRLSHPEPLFVKLRELLRRAQDQPEHH